jgi:N-acetylneuraminic acid mutarotase
VSYETHENFDVDVLCSYRVVLLLVGTASVAFAQISAVSHNTWSSGAAIPTALLVPAVGVLGGQIYLVGGYNGAPLADTQIYNPATNTWSTGTPLPTPTNSATAAVVNNILYVIGGSTDGSNSQTKWGLGV